MKKVITYGGEELVLKCVAMSHSSVGGEYEIKISKKLDLNLENLSKKLSGSNYQCEELKSRSLSLNHNNSTITILNKGSILIQDLLPDTYEEAIKIGEELINAEQMGEK
jgi:hypothetical protein